MNNIAIIGNLVDAPELRYTQQSNKAVANMRIAVNNQYNRDETYFFSVIAWNKLAELVANLTKGQKIGVTGRLTSRTYERKEGGKATAVEIVADQIDFLTPKNQQQSQQPAPAQQDSNLDEWQKLGREVKPGYLDMFDGKADDSEVPF